MGNISARAFDHFATADAAANELLDLGFAEHGVQITSNPRNPDGLPGISLADEAQKLPAILERIFVNLFDIDDARDTIRSRRIEALRRGGVIVAVCVADDRERKAAQHILHRHRGVDLEYEPGGYPLY